MSDAPPSFPMSDLLATILSDPEIISGILAFDERLDRIEKHLGINPDIEDHGRPPKLMPALALVKQVSQ